VVAVEVVVHLQTELVVVLEAEHETQVEPTAVPELVDKEITAEDQEP
jgi:hypothetical protein